MADVCCGVCSPYCCGTAAMAQARQVAGLYFDPARPLAVVAADGSLARHQGDKGLVALVKPSRDDQPDRGRGHVRRSAHRPRGILGCARPAGPSV